MRASKGDLVERVLIAEQAYADTEDRWIRTADDLLVWIMLVDWLIASRVEPLRSTFISILNAALAGPATTGRPGFEVG